MGDLTSTGRGASFRVEQRHRSEILSSHRGQVRRRQRAELCEKVRVLRHARLPHELSHLLCFLRKLIFSHTRYARVRPTYVGVAHIAGNPVRLERHRLSFHALGRRHVAFLSPS